MILHRNNYGLFRRNRIESDRPVMRPDMGPIDWLLEAIAISGLMFFLGYTIYNYPHIPETIPTHFNSSGQADEYGSRASFIILPGIAFFVYILLTLISLIPYRFNFTVKITPENAQRQYIMATRMIRTLKSSLIWGFFYLSYATIRVAEGAASGLGIWFVPLFLGIILIPLINYFIMAHLKR